MRCRERIRYKFFETIMTSAVIFVTHKYQYLILIENIKTTFKVTHFYQFAESLENERAVNSFFSFLSIDRCHVN